MPNQAIGIDLLFNGSQCLKDRENQLNYAELAYNARLVTYDKNTGTPPSANLAVFLSAASPLAPLQLISLGPSPAATLAGIIAAGKLIVFHSTIWVTGMLDDVVGVR